MRFYRSPHFKLAKNILLNSLYIQSTSLPDEVSNKQIEPLWAAPKYDDIRAVRGWQVVLSPVLFSVTNEKCRYIIYA